MSVKPDNRRRYTISKRSTSPPPKPARQYLAALISNYCVFCFGTAVGWTNAGEQIVKGAYSFTPTKDEWAWTCALLPLLAGCMSLPMGALMKNHGSKAIMLFQLLPYVLGWTMLIYANSVYMLYVGRSMLGISGAALFVAVPVYNAETCLLSNRGAMVSLFYGALIYGIIFNNVMTEYAGVRVTNVVCLVLAVFCATLKLIPYSPTFYIFHGKVEQAQASMRWLRGDQYNGTKELRLLLESATPSEMNLRANWIEAMQHKRTLRSVPRASVLLLLYQTCGGIIISGHIRDIFGNLSESGLSLYVLGVSFAMCVGHLVCFLLVDRYGRRPLLLSSSVIMFFCSLHLCIWFKWMQATSWRWPPSISLFLFVAAFSMGFGPVSWILTVELIIEPIRAYGCAVAATISWLVAFLLTFKYCYILYHHAIFYFMLIVCMVGLLFVVIFMPETKGLTSKEIQEVLRRRSLNEDYSSEE